MLGSRRLDDQRFEEIVAEAEGRLPWLCPVWTDHNAHDPGITLLELMAWYKELQQYQLDQLTPAMQRKLLALAGLQLAPARPASCALEVPPEAPARPALTRLTTPRETPFELAEPIPAVRPVLARLLVEQPDGRQVDVAALAADGTPFPPFAFGGGAGSSLLLGFSRRPEETLRLWFQVKAPAGVRRNAPDADSLPPRTLVWEPDGAGPVRPLEDGTWALSWSGYVALPAPDGWSPGADGLWWLRLRQAEGGCEEQVRLCGVSAGRYRALQQETRAAAFRFAVAAAPEQTVFVPCALAAEAGLLVYLRDAGGWRPADAFRADREAQGLRLTVDASGAAGGGENLLLVCLDRQHARELRFDARGLPGEQFSLRLDGQTVLTERLRLLCSTLQADGSVRPAEWRCVDDLSACGPRDRVFTYDARRELLTFGDGLHGAVVMPGAGAVLVTELVLSQCGGGNIPADLPLTFRDDDAPVRHGAADGGRGAETLREGRARLLARLGRTEKCLSAEDFARCARETPGLRVAAARALPDFDAAAPRQRRSALVSVVVLPAGEGPRPMADGRFLAAVNRQLERCRPVCIRTAAIPARYVPFAVSGRVVAAAGTDAAALRAALEACFAPREARIGAPARQEDAAAALQRVPGVLRVERLTLRGLDQGSYRTPAGDLQVLPDAILSLERAELELARP